jgi:hypothetical protein
LRTVRFPLESGQLPPALYLLVLLCGLFLMRILGIDPGDRTGYCLIERKPLDLIDRGIIQKEDFNKWLLSWADMNLGIVVCEDWIKRPDFEEGRWAKMDTPEKVGACGWRAFELGVTFVKLQPSLKPEGYKAAKLPYRKGKHGKDDEDAAAHAFYVAVHGFTPAQKKW